MASGLPDDLPDDFMNTIEVVQDSSRLGTLTWVMDDAVALAFNALPIEEQNYRKELLRHLMESATAVLTCSAVVPESEVTGSMCQGIDMLMHQANRTLLRMTIMA
jgi:hypothetical protein